MQRLTKLGASGKGPSQKRSLGIYTLTVWAPALHTALGPVVGFCLGSPRCSSAPAEPCSDWPPPGWCCRSPKSPCPFTARCLGPQPLSPARAQFAGHTEVSARGVFLNSINPYSIFKYTVFVYVQEYVLNVKIFIYRYMCGHIYAIDKLIQSTYMLVKPNPTRICPYSGFAEYLQGHPSTFQCYTIFLAKSQLSPFSFPSWFVMSFIATRWK